VNALLAALLTVVAVIGTLTVLIREPVRQAIMAGVLGLSLSALFFALQSPDVGLSEIAVGGAGIPIMLLLAIAKIRAQQAEMAGADDEEREQ
jgi:uncharacterized MnhB-related membrane protein